MPIQPVAPSKPWYQSKTLWVNFIAIAGMFIPAAQSYIAQHPTASVDVIGALNVFLRLISGDRIEIS